MEMIVFTGLQASGKSTFFHANFADTHLRINLDMLRTRRRESAIIEACLGVGQRMVIDNTNPMKSDWARYLKFADEFHFDMIGYYFTAPLETCMARNNLRSGKARVRERGLRATAAKLEVPCITEGFKQLSHVDETGGFAAVQEIDYGVR